MRVMTPMDPDLAGLRGRAATIRRHVVEMVRSAGLGHLGGSLSVVDILTALYFRILRVDPGNPAWPERDRLVLSKGHAAAALYATLAERGYFPREILTREFIRCGGSLQEHPDMAKVPGVDMSTGSLGQGFSIAVGMALGGRMGGRGFRAWVVLGDGELQEGQVWEAAMSAAHYKLDNLTAVIDLNGLQVSGQVAAVMDIGPLRRKWEAFGWTVSETGGHDFSELVPLLRQAIRSTGRPQVVIARTVKGKGVSFAEGNVGWHSGSMTDEEYQEACDDLGRQEESSGA